MCVHHISYGDHWEDAEMSLLYWSIVKARYFHNVIMLAQTIKYFEGQESFSPITPACLRVRVCR
jgi:hypothetical protein